MKKNTDKMKSSEVYVPSYCPLELYSSDTERVKKALYALWDDWEQSNGTINMLRIFVNGEVLHPNEVHTPPAPPRQTLSILSLIPSVSFRSPRLRGSLRKSTPTTRSPLICGPSSQTRWRRY